MKLEPGALGDLNIPLVSFIARMPRTRCDPGEGPLWCLVMAGPSANLYHAASLAAMQELRRGTM